MVPNTTGTNTRVLTCLGQVLTTDPYMVELLLLITSPYYNERRDADPDTGKQQIVHDSACTAALAELPKTPKGIPAWLKKKLKNRFSTDLGLPDKDQLIRAKYLLQQCANARADIYIHYQ